MFYSQELFQQFSLKQKVYLHDQQIEEWESKFGFVIPGSTNSWELTITAGDNVLTPEILSGNLTIETIFYDGDKQLLSSKARIYYVYLCFTEIDLQFLTLDCGAKQTKISTNSLSYNCTGRTISIFSISWTCFNLVTIDARVFLKLSKQAYSQITGSIVDHREYTLDKLSCKIQT